jgi:hypothetical protein
LFAQILNTALQLNVFLDEHVHNLEALVETCPSLLINAHIIVVLFALLLCFLKDLLNFGNSLQQGGNLLVLYLHLAPDVFEFADELFGEIRFSLKLHDF